MKTALTIILCAMASIVSASWFEGETRVYAGAWSTHIGDMHYTTVNVNPDGSISKEKHKLDLNETHNLVAVEYKRIIAGYFKNSFSDDTAVVGVNVLEKKWGDFTGKLFVGATYGYRECFGHNPYENKRVCPAVVPMVTYDKYEIVQPYVGLFGNAVAVGFSKKF